MTDNEFSDADIFDDIDVELNHFQELYPNLNDNETSKYYNVDNYNKLPPKHKSDLNILYQNIRSLNCNYDNISGFLDSINAKFDILCFSESWLTTHSTKFYEFQNYNSFHSLRKSVKLLSHGGVSAYVSNTLDASVIANCTIICPYIETLFLNINKNNKHFTLGVIYRPPNSDSQLFFDKIDAIISSLNLNNSKDCIICGDFNFNMLNYVNCNNTLKFMNLMNSVSLIPIISKPSRITHNSATLIDNIFTNQPIDFNAGLFTCDFSDHLPLFFNIRNFFINPDCHSSREIKYRLINDQTLNQLADHLSNFDFSSVLDSNCIDSSIHLFDEILLKSYNEFCPIITKKIKIKDIKKPWINKDIKKIINKRSNLYILLNSKKISRESYARYRNFVTSQIRLAKKKYFEDKFSHYKNNARETWKIINSVIGKNSRSEASIKKLISRNNSYENPVDISNLLNNHFCTIGSNIAQNFRTNLNEHKKYLNNSTASSFFFAPIIAPDVRAIIMNFKSKKSCIDSYGIDLLKYLSNIISPIIASLINKSMTSGKFPKMFKLARVIPLPKPGAKTDVNNYRPISILPILSKLFEKIVYKQLNYYLEQNNILYKHQYGFRKNHSTTQAIINTLKYLYSNLDSGKLVLSIFLDFKKAFDCVSHKILLSKLHSYGIRGIALEWFESYLTDRSQYTSINGINSSIQNVSHGVPQGSILGPLLFLIFINDIHNSSNLFNYTLFADDSTLSVAFENNNLRAFVKILNKELKNVYKWLCANHISINIIKTKYILFSLKKTIKLPGVIKIGKGKIASTDNIKFLGVFIDRHLTFNNHINNLSVKISRSVGLLYKLNKYLPQTVLLKIYHSLIHPYFNYAMETWFNINNYSSNKLITLQKKSMRAIFNVPYNSHTKELFRTSNTIKLKDLFDFKIALYMYKTLELNFDPELLSSLSKVNNIHSHNTRNNDHYQIPRYFKNKCKNNINVVGSQILNKIPRSLYQKKNLYSFKKSLKKYLTSEY